MSLALERAGGGAHISMPESVTVNCVADLHRLFLEAISAKENIQIDFARTTELDASAVQLLYRACQKAGSLGLTVAVAGTLPELIEKTFRQVGLDPFRRALQSLGQ